MKKATLIQVAILFIAGLIPLLWFKPGLIFANGDEFPLFINPSKTFSSGLSMWSTDYNGYASPMPSLALYQYSTGLLNYLGLSVGSIQMLFLVLLYLGAGLSMYYFSKKIYPEHKIAPFFAAFFYMFNLFVLQSRLNLGFAWTYAFLPLLLASFVKAVEAAHRKDRKAANMGIVYFVLLSVVALSVASINPANIALFVFALSILALYYLVKYRKELRTYLLTIAKIIAVAVPANLWWLLPMLNAFVFSPPMLNSQISIDAWSWTHVRASFLNLFWFNGIWGWLPIYVPYINFYSNVPDVKIFWGQPIVQLLVFIPFLVAASTLLFRSKRFSFNAYIMLAVLFILFLAKGLHDPLSDLNRWLYQVIPAMNMFREPASKFTMLTMPFVALLIGSACENIANLKVKLKPKILRIAKLSILAFIVLSFIISAFPLFINPVESKSEELPFSSYVQIPQYWFEAADWINTQPGDWKVLLTPLNDFYQMPYSWGFYGSDQLWDRFFKKPIISSVVLDGYAINPETATTLVQLKASIKFNRTVEFKTLLDLLGIRYIVQRNDVQSDLVGRRLMRSSEMKVFFANQTYLKLVKQFGELDIYEYTESKPSLYTVSPSSLQKIDVHIDYTPVLNKMWNFSFGNDVEEWKNSTLPNQSQATCTINQNGSYLKADMWNSTEGWITVTSPLLPANYESSYLLKTIVAGDNSSQVNIKIAEYSSNMTLITNSSTVAVGDWNFDWTSIWLKFELESPETKFFSVEFWNYFKANETSESSVWLDSVDLTGEVSTLNMTGIGNIFDQASESKTASVLQVKSTSSTRIIITVNATEPFVLATNQVLDKFWVAYVNGQQFQPMPLYLGLKGFLINATGQLDVTIEYEPQLWFDYSLAIGIATVLFLCTGLVYLNREKLKGAYLRINKRTPEM